MEGEPQAGLPPVPAGEPGGAPTETETADADGCADGAAPASQSGMGPGLCYGWSGKRAGLASPDDRGWLFT